MAGLQTALGYGSFGIATAMQMAMVALSVLLRDTEGQKRLKTEYSKSRTRRKGWFVDLGLLLWPLVVIIGHNREESRNTQSWAAITGMALATVALALLLGPLGMVEGVD